MLPCLPRNALEAVDPFSGILGQSRGVARRERNTQEQEILFTFHNKNAFEQETVLQVTAVDITMSAYCSYTRTWVVETLPFNTKRLVEFFAQEQEYLRAELKCEDGRYVAFFGGQLVLLRDEPLIVDLPDDVVQKLLTTIA